MDEIEPRPSVFYPPGLNVKFYSPSRAAFIPFINLIRPLNVAKKKRTPFFPNERIENTLRYARHLPRRRLVILIAEIHLTREPSVFSRAHEPFKAMRMRTVPLTMIYRSSSIVTRVRAIDSQYVYS